MKIVALFLTLISTTISIPTNQISLYRRTTTEDDFSLSEGCNTFISKYDKCFSDDQFTHCHDYTSTFCTEFYNINLQKVPECIKDTNPKVLSYMEHLLKSEHLSNQFYCSTDEQSRPCPIPTLDLSSGLDQTIENNKDYITQFMQAVNSTCTSRRCSDAYIEFYESYKVLKKDLNGFTMTSTSSSSLSSEEENYLKRLKDVADYLKRQNCTVSAADANSSSIVGVVAFSSRTIAYYISIGFYLIYIIFK